MPLYFNTKYYESIACAYVLNVNIALNLHFMKKTRVL